MRKSLTFDGILFHGQSIRALSETGSLEFFGDSGTENSASVLDVHEAGIVRWLLGHPEASRLLYSQAQLDPLSLDCLSVGRPIIENANAKPGDVDWLCVPASHTHGGCVRVQARQGPGRGTGRRAREQERRS